MHGSVAEPFGLTHSPVAARLLSIAEEKMAPYDRGAGGAAMGSCLWSFCGLPP